MNWGTFAAINLAGLVIGFLILVAFVKSVMKDLEPSQGGLVFFSVVVTIFKFSLVGVNVYFLVSYLTAPEKQWVPIIMWGLAALWWLFAKLSVSTKFEPETLGGSTILKERWR